jgi:predicted metal-dependent phosphotriesterase family hydrolase
MTEKTIETTLGPLPLEQLGTRINAHDHLFLDSGPGGVNVPDFLLDDVDKTAAEIKRWAQAGGGAIVDTMPTTGRNVDKCIEVSRRTGVPIIMSTGFHKGSYYWPDHWRYLYDEDEIVDLVTAEIIDGIERTNYRGPIVRRSTVKAGVMKIAGEYNHVSDNMKKLIRVVGRVHQNAGTPIYAHTEHGTAVEELLDLLEDAGVPLSHVLICHLDRNPDFFLHRRVAERGVFLEYDTPSRIKYQPESIVIGLMREMIEAGYGDRLMLGGDMARRSYLKAYGGGPGFEYLLTVFTPRLIREGFTEEDLHQIWEANPLRWLAG